LLRIVNLALKFILELCAIATLAYSAYDAPLPLPWCIVAGMAAASILVVAWGLFLVPTARSGLSQAQKDAIGCLVLLGVASALAAAGQRLAALIYAVAIVINAVLLVALRDRGLPVFISNVRA
jgi:hypothetical protein